jgi:hypothetical protein
LVGSMNGLYNFEFLSASVNCHPKGDTVQLENVLQRR